MPITKLVAVVDGVLDLWAFHPQELYAAEQLSDGTIILRPATGEQHAFAANVADIEDAEDFAPGVTIRPVYGDAISADPADEEAGGRRFPWNRRR